MKAAAKAPPTANRPIVFAGESILKNEKWKNSEFEREGYCGTRWKSIPESDRKPSSTFSSEVLALSIVFSEKTRVT